MAIKIKKEQLERIVLEELTRFMAESLSASRLNEQDPGTETADEIPDPEQAPEEQLPTDSPAGEAGDEPNQQPDEEDQSDEDLDAIDAGEEPPSEEEAGTVAGELSGKTIEKISVDEDSKIMPGATEVILSFRESPDAFRLLITKSGTVKYFYRGIHNTLESEIAPMPGDDKPEEPEEIGAGEEEGPSDDEELEDMTPLGDEDIPPETTTGEEDDNTGGN